MENLVDPVTDPVVTPNEETATQPEAQVGEPEKSSEPNGQSEPDWFVKKIGKMTRQKYEMQSQIEALQDQVKQLNEKPEPELTKDDFDGDEDGYLDYRVKQQLDKRDQEFQTQQRELAQKQYEQQQIQESWQSKVETAKKKYPDYTERVKEIQVGLTPGEQEMILESSVGTDIAYALSTDDNAAREFNSLRTEKARERFLTKMELKFELNPVSAPQSKPVTQAPPVTPKLEGVGGTGGKKSINEMSMDEYVKSFHGE